MSAAIEKLMRMQVEEEPPPFGLPSWGVVGGLYAVTDPDKPKDDDNPCYVGIRGDAIHCKHEPGTCLAALRVRIHLEIEAATVAALQEND
jgi:hypothetical protein